MRWRARCPEWDGHRRARPLAGAVLVSAALVHRHVQLRFGLRDQ